MNKEAQLKRSNLIRLVFSKPGRTSAEYAKLDGCRPQEMGQRLTKAGFIKIDGCWYPPSWVKKAGTA